jgi:hypothetical protein
MLKIFSNLILVIFLVSGCAALSKPVPLGLHIGMRDGAPEGTEVFRDGWKDGCHSGLAATGHLQYKFSYDYTYNEKMLDNDEYHNAWRLGFRHCRWYVSQWYRQ